MIEIRKAFPNEGGSQGDRNYTDEIKHIREYCASRYGVPPGLKQSKDLIDSIYDAQPKSVTLSPDDIKEIRATAQSSFYQPAAYDALVILLRQKGVL